MHAQDTAHFFLSKWQSIRWCYSFADQKRDGYTNNKAFNEWVCET